MTRVERARVVGRIADHLAARRPDHPLRVGVDGVTAAGKTTLAAELCEAVAQRGRAVIGLPMDGFHHRRSHRYRRGRESADGYYRDVYDLESFARLVLGLFGPGGNRRYPVALLDLDRDEPVEASGSNRHPIVRQANDPDDAVPGTCFSNSPAELAATDRYEVDDDRRVLVRLTSGTDAWV